MSDQCFSSRILSDFQQILSFMHSHPLYFFFIFFFSPYLVKIFSFLSPLFITISLILLVLLTGFIHENPTLQLSEPKLGGFLLSIYNAVTERLKSSSSSSNTTGIDAKYEEFQQLEAYKMVFDTSSFYDREKFEVSEEKFCQELEEPLLKSSCHEYSGLSSEEKTVEVAWEEISEPIKEVKNLEGLFKELDDFDSIKLNSEDKDDNVLSTEYDKDGRNKKESPLIMESEEKRCLRDISVESGEYPSIAVAKLVTFYEGENGTNETSKITKDNNCGGYNKPKTMSSFSQKGGEYGSNLFESPSSRAFESNLGAYGSMRKDKEWKRTLACKLFEERHNGNGSPEGMDSLWETYEMDRHRKVNSKSKNKKKEEAESDDDDYEEGMGANLCCLQALKFSTGKMNMGGMMGKPNFMKFTKAIKGMGWLHKHGKKGKLEA